MKPAPRSAIRPVPLLGERVERRRVQYVVDEGADRPGASRQGRGARRQMGFEQQDVVRAAGSLVRGRKEGTVIRFGAEHRDFHRFAPSRIAVARR